MGGFYGSDEERKVFFKYLDTKCLFEKSYVAFKYEKFSGTEKFMMHFIDDMFSSPDEIENKRAKDSALDGMDLGTLNYKQTERIMNDAVFSLKRTIPYCNHFIHYDIATNDYLRISTKRGEELILKNNDWLVFVKKKDYFWSAQQIADFHKMNGKRGDWVMYVFTDEQMYSILGYEFPENEYYKDI